MRAVFQEMSADSIFIPYATNRCLPHPKFLQHEQQHINFRARELFTIRLIIHRRNFLSNTSDKKRTIVLKDYVYHLLSNLCLLPVFARSTTALLAALLQKFCCQARPAGLMRRAQTKAGVAVKVFVKQ